MTDILTQLNNKIDILEKENFKLKSLLEDYGISEEKKISDQEWICIKEIERLKKLSQDIGLEDDQVAMLDTLTKVLQREREQVKTKKAHKGKKESVDNLLKIATSGEE